MANFALKMKLIIWKNLIIRKRRWLYTTFEIVIPVLLFVILASLNTLIPGFEKRFISETQYKYIDEFRHLRTVYFAPNNTRTSQIINTIKAENARCDDCEYRGFENEGSMINYLAEDSDNYYLDVVAVVFNNVPNDTLPNKLDYRIRPRNFNSDINRLFSSFSPYQAHENNEYVYSNVRTLQYFIDRTFIHLKEPQPYLNRYYNVVLQEMPDPPHWETSSLDVMFSSVMPICTVFAFTLVLVSVIQRIMEEKASGIKSKKHSPSSLWVYYSMLRSTIGINKNIDIKSFQKLYAFVKRQNVGNEVKKAKVLCDDEFKKFLIKAEDEEYLLAKELMKMMGLKSWMLWVGWYIHSIIVMLIAIIFITIMLKVSFSAESTPLNEFSDGFLLWIFLFLYCTSGICFCFMVSTWLKKPMLGASVGTVVWTVTIVPVMILQNNDDKSSLTFVRNFILIFPNSCISYGFKTIYGFESKEIGMQWDNLYEVPNEYYPYHSIGKIFIMLVVDSLIFLILTWYIDNVNPGDYGIRRSFIFPFQKSYWCPRKISTESSEDYVDSRDGIEAVPTDLQAGIQIRNLHKEFKKKKAVNGLNFDIYNNQITVLLGHNGAGKTTTMNIITGMISPSSGSVLVDGYSMQTNMDKVRESLGLCPQHNVQFPDLTVVEHLMFFAMWLCTQTYCGQLSESENRGLRDAIEVVVSAELKGMQKKEAREESLDYLSRLCMTAKANEKASTLSGGMRRRLSLGMALVGHTKVLMLDEPTSGMDPEARREIWDLLLSMRGERTILITTHYMEEADILGDRIAIMHSGQLMCYGTSLFLKKHYGTGYTLSILLARELDMNVIINAIHTFVPNATVKNVSVGTIKFELPTSDTTALSQLFLDLETKKQHLGIASFGVSITTMDDVFLKVGKIADEVDNGNNTNSETNSETLLLNGHNAKGSKDNYNTGFKLSAQQFLALLIKRLQYTRHKLFIFFIAILIPLAFELVTVLSNPKSGNSNQNISRKFSLGIYPDAQSLYSFDPENKDLANYYEKVVKLQKGIPTAVEGVSDAIIDQAEKNPDNYFSTLITAAEFNYTKNQLIINGMYGSFPIHSSIISLNLITNALLKHAMRDTNDEYSITIGINPLPENYSFAFGVDGITWMNLYPMGLTLLIAMILGFHTSERLSGVKHLQIMSGVSRIMYWLNNYFFDMFIYLIVVALSIIILAVFDESLSAPHALQAFSQLIIFFGLAAFPFSYFFHYRPTSGSVITFSIWAKIIFGTILPIVIVTWENAPEEKKAAREALTFIFMLFPHFAVSYGLQKLVDHAVLIYLWDNMTDAKKQNECNGPSRYACCKPKSQECKDFYNYFTGDMSIEKSVLFLIVEIFIYFILFLLVDYGLFSKYFDKFMDVFRKGSSQIDDNNINNQLDSDVIEENIRVATQINESRRTLNQSNSDVLLVSNLRKWFANFHAVKGVNFGVKESQCFGLLGINGAGKTTTFKMLTGEICVSTGTAKILQYSLLQDQKTYLKQIGYCPQFDVFNFELSTRQMLTFFAHLRGIPQNDIKNQVNKWLVRFDIMKYQDIKSAKLSGGNKRKLSTAIALIGEPPLLMLDEPTSGVDPVARRNLWSILSALRESGQAIVLTSHSMDECEALCDRLAIMVDGQMKCIGDIQYLKNKFGQGFTVMIKLRHVTSIQTNENDSFENQLSDLKTVIENKYVCTLKDEHKGMVMYHITDSNITLGEIFKYMEDLKQTKEIVEDFTVGDTSLEQVFLSFAKDKIAADDKKNKRGANTVEAVTV